MKNPTLWSRIAAHPMPADAAGLSFVDQLCKDQKIKVTTAMRGIEEYRRFLYLSALNEGRCVPSRAVDAVWHLHLTHTRDYWDRFVPNALAGRPIHHQPGSPAGHGADYARTVARYETEFGEAPPKGIWRRAGWNAVFGIAFILLWMAVWVGISIASGIFVLAVVGVAFGMFFLWSVLGEAFPALGLSVDFWSDDMGGNCGDGDAGGCGD